MLVYGKNVARDLLYNDKEIKKIFLQDNFSDKDIISMIENRNIPVERLSKKQMASFYRRVFPQR